MQGVDCVLVQSELLHMSGDTHDLFHPLAPSSLLIHEVLADRVLAGKVLGGEIFVDHHYELRVVVVGWTEKSSALQRSLHQLQVLRLNHILQRIWQVGSTCRLRLPLHPETLLGISLHGMGAPIERGRLHSWHRAYGRMHFTVSCADRIRALARQR